MRKNARRQAQQAAARDQADARASSGDQDGERAEPVDYDASLYETPTAKNPGPPAVDPELLQRPGQPRTPPTPPTTADGSDNGGGHGRGDPAHEDRQDGRGAAWEEIEGVRIERDERPSAALQLVGDSPVLRHACRPTSRPLPGGDTTPATDAAQQALRTAATLGSITSLGDWQAAGQQAARQATETAKRAREQALVEAKATGRGEEETRRLAERRARSALHAALGPHADESWRTPIKDLELGDADAHTLEVIARLHLAAPLLLAQLLDEPLGQRAVYERLARLHDAGLVARANVGVQGRRGRPPVLYAIASRGLEYLRARRQQLAPDKEVASYLDAQRKLPAAGKGQEVPHELALQVALVALRQYDRRLHWHTTRMPGGRWDVGMIHHDRRDRTLRLGDLLPAPGYSVHGEQLKTAPSTLEPDLSVQLHGPEQERIDMLLEVDRTSRSAYNQRKFTAYDHFLGGWCLRTRRFGDELRTRPLMVFVTHQARATLALLSAADEAMTLGFGAPGTYEAAAFEYPGRAHIAFTCLEWLLAGHGLALRLPALPPHVRGRETQMQPERVALVPEAWWPRRARSSA